MGYGMIYAAVSNKHYKPNVDDIFLAIYKATGLKKEIILQRTRKREIANCKQIICYYLNDKMKMTLHQTAKIVGYDNHTTVIYCVDIIKDRIKAQDDWTLRILSNMYNQLSF